MAAGLGFKDFTTGEILLAADVDGYLMQGVWVFADAAARDAAVTSPEEGNFAYLKDTNVTTYYTGSTWANLDTTGMTNPMTTTGDTIYSSSGSTPARLGIGSTGDVLTVAGGVPSWAAPAGGGGGKVLQAVQGTSTTQTTVSSGTFTDTTLTVNITPATTGSTILVLVTQYFYSGSNPINLGLRIMRGGTVVYSPGDYVSTNVGTYKNTGGSGSDHIFVQHLHYLDSPSSTSALTYKTQLATGNSASVTAQGLDMPSVITVMEIGA